VIQGAENAVHEDVFPVAMSREHRENGAVGMRLITCVPLQTAMNVKDAFKTGCNAVPGDQTPEL
jgi:hypothetical protein